MTPLDSSPTNPSPASDDALEFAPVDRVSREQVERVAARRRQVQAEEARRAPGRLQHVSGDANVGEVPGRCRWCEQEFVYDAPRLVFPTGKVHSLVGPRTWCHAEACVAKHEAEREAARVAEYERMAAEDLERRRAAYLEQVPPMYHREARIAPASLEHVVDALAAWDERQSLYLSGPSSSGKSHQIASLMHRVAGRVSFEWYSTRRLLADAQAAIGSKGKLEPPSIIAHPCRPRVLVLNDAFAERATEWAATTIGNLVDARYEAGLAVVFTSNVAIDEIPGTADTSRRDAAAVTLELKRIAERILEMTTPPYGIRHVLEDRNWRHALAAGEVSR